MLVRKNVKTLRIIRMASKFAVCTFLYALLATYIDLYVVPWDVHVTVIGLLAGAISILIGFRNASAYERWWEGRKLWGSLINSSRDWARLVKSFIPNREDQGKLIRWQILYVHSLRIKLRDHDEKLDPSEYKKYGFEDQDFELFASPDPTIHINLEQSKLLKEKCESDIITAMISEKLTEMLNVQGACERIKRTPFPRQYDYFPKVFLFILTLLMPFGFSQHLGWRTPVVTMLVAVIFYCLDKIGEYLENPFDHGLQDLPLNAMCRTIEKSLLQVLEIENLPNDLEPVDGFLH